MPVKFYSGEDFGTGLTVVNTPDPINAQDVATKHYVDTHTPTPFSKQILWEYAYASTFCGNASFTGAVWQNITTGPVNQGFTKLRADTNIRVKMQMSFFVNTPGNVYYGIGVNGSPVVQVLQYYANVANCHLTTPWYDKTMTAVAYPTYVGVAGNSGVGFLVMCSAGVTWNTNSGDSAYWLISEVMP